jgi:hypothetical protein
MTDHRAGTGMEPGAGIGEDAGMSDHPVDRALGLWSDPELTGAAARDAFLTVYRDPLMVNGVETPVQVLVDRAAMLQQAFEGFGHEMLERIDTDGRSAFAFRLSGRHVGSLETPLGPIPPTGKQLSVLGMDIFAIADDRVEAVWAVADFLGLMIEAGAVALNT